MEAAKKTIQDFMEAWKDQNYKQMHELCTKTYKVGNTVANLKALLTKQIVSFGGIQLEESTDCVIDATLSIKPKRTKKARKVKARLICESDPFKASIEGEWGVNPISILRGLNG